MSVCYMKEQPPTEGRKCMFCDVFHPVDSICSFEKIYVYLRTELNVLKRRIKSLEESINVSQLDMSPDYIQGCVNQFKQDIQNIFEQIRDLRELRYETHQNEGCTRAKVENDLMPKMEIVFEKLEQLEGYMEMEDRVTDSDVLLRLTQLEKKLHDLISMPNIAWAKYNKTPHTCPACDAIGRRQVIPSHNPMVLEPFEKRIIDSQGRHFVECNTCEGNGIVWG